MQCARCNAENPEQANICLNCGAGLTLICSECGMELSPHAKFCFSCGAQMAASEPMGDRGSAAVRALKRLAPAEFAKPLLATRVRWPVSGAP
jgi:ribosomal protein L40E